jgi:GT2 family glycosyltransferase
MFLDDPTIKSGNIKNAEITVVIPTKNGDDLTKKCIDLLMAGKIKPTYIYIVADELPSAALCDLEKNVNNNYNVKCELLRTNGGKGFSATVNTGLRKSTTDTLVINNDCFVGHYALYEMLNDLYVDDLASAISPTLTDKGWCSIQSPYVQKLCKYDTNTYTSNLELIETGIRTNKTPPQKRNHLPWTCILIKHGSLKECRDLNGKMAKPIGFLNQDDFASGLYADDEWCLRSTQNGLHLLLCTNAVAEHNESSTFKRLNIDYEKCLTDGENQWLNKCKVLTCVLSCDRKSYSTSGIESANILKYVDHVHLNWETGSIFSIFNRYKNCDSLTRWSIKPTGSIPTKPKHDQDQLYRLPRIIAARNWCLDLMRIHTDFTHLLFIDSDVLVDDKNGLKRLLLNKRPLIGGLVHGRGAHSEIKMMFGNRIPIHNRTIECDWGTCGYQLINRLLCERYQFRWGNSKIENEHRSEDPAFAEDVSIDNWGRYAIDKSVTAQHVDNNKKPLLSKDVAQF